MKKNELPIVKKKKKTSLTSFKKLALKVKKYLEEEERQLQNENNKGSRISTSY